MNMYAFAGGGGGPPPLFFEFSSETSGMDSSYNSVHSSSHILFALEAPKSKYLALKFGVGQNPPPLAVLGQKKRPFFTFLSLQSAKMIFFVRNLILH